MPAKSNAKRRFGNDSLDCLSQPVEERGLRGVDFLTGFPGRGECGLVDFRERPNFSGSRRPFQFEKIGHARQRCERRNAYSFHNDTGENSFRVATKRIIVMFRYWKPELQTMNILKRAAILSAATFAFTVWVAGQQPGAQPIQPQQPAPQQTVETEELIETFGFVVGLQSGLRDLNLDDAEFDSFLDGLKRAHGGESIPENINEIIPQMQAFLTARQTEVVEGKSRENRAEAERFFAELAERDDVRQTDEGIYIEVEEEGTGESPDPTKTVLIHYEGRLIDGTVFDSSHQRNEPAEFPLTGVIQGMAIGVSQLREGGKATLYIPPDLGYGDQSQPAIPPGSALIFEVELLEVMETEEPAFSPEMVPQMQQQR